MESFREAATLFLLLSRKKKTENPEKNTAEKKPKQKNNFSLKMCYFVNVSFKESNLQCTSKLICCSICNILLLLSLLKYDQLKWERQMTLIWKKIFISQALR